jgi:2-polyprenyl-3-methyl-5-hydroxy-6-metoxy-1,4-benzoquinol methylase
MEEQASGSKFSDEDARVAWNAGAQAWEEFVESEADYYRHEVHGPGLLAVCEPVTRRRVLDLGCGQGFFCRQLANRGARVVGVDVAEQQIAFARMHEKREPLGIEYHVMGAAEADRHWPEGHFDLITACMALQDMADAGAVLRSGFAVLREGGRVVFSIPHPCTDTPVREWELDEQGSKAGLRIDHYFESGPTVCHWNMQRLRYHWATPYWRRTLSEWSTLVAGAGFLVRRLAEPRPTVVQVRRIPPLGDCYRLPCFLIFELVKPG